MKNRASKPLNIEHAQIGYRNFRGAEGPYNREGAKSFVVFLSPDYADEIAREGWNVKYPKPNPNINPEEDQRQPYLPVEVRFDNIPPKVVLIAGEKVTLLEESQIGTLDHAELESVDLVIQPYQWEMNGNTGVKAYLKSIYATLKMDPFTEKYGV